ncbi:hypothetical protein LIER_39413 [Lithospermum erythrorhizon]|uniref:M-phase phosphoprotein 6 n=1 Tax=Lithospermum erythrorhizon TaxID=34254 RepID=A0AAV3QEF8_LITER
MAKRELSSTLKNLKFMQRAAQREERTAKKVEEIVPDTNFTSSAPPKRCVVVMEGDPHPGAIRGRMSFLSFNPSIDKLDQETNSGKAEASETCNGRQREVDEEADLVPNGSTGNNGELKRKQTDGDSEAIYPNKSPKNIQANLKSSPSSSQRSQKQSKRDKLDWKLLRPPKAQHKKE